MSDGRNDTCKHGDNDTNTNHVLADVGGVARTNDCFDVGLEYNVPADNYPKRVVGGSIGRRVASC